MGHYIVHEDFETPIFIGGTDGAWHEYDLSPIVGKRVVVAVIRAKYISGYGASDLDIVFRTKGDTGKYYDPALTATGQRGFHSANVVSTIDSYLLLAITNEDGIFEYIGNNLSGTAFWLYGWFIPTSYELKDLYNGVMPTSYTNVGTEIINKKAIMFLRYETSSNSDHIAVRAKGDSRNYLHSTTVNRGSVAFLGDANIADFVETACVKSTSNQLQFEHIASNTHGGPPTVNLDLLAYENEGFVGCDINLFNIKSNYTSYNYKINLLPYTNNRRALCFFRCYYGGSTNYGEISCRPSDDLNLYHGASANDPYGAGTSYVRLQPNQYGVIICPTGFGKSGYEWARGHINFYIYSVPSSNLKSVDLIGYIPEVPDDPYIRDYWYNKLVTPASINVLGYREADEEFPHQIYSFFLSSIRDDDISKTRLLYRWLYGMQQIWESQYAKILSLPDLYSPDNCPSEFLEYFKDNVGITDDLNALWGSLNENEKRRLIKYFVYFLQIRGSKKGIAEIIQSMSGKYSEVVSFFDMRYIVSGNIDEEIETALGREDLGYDPYLLSEHNVKRGYRADAISISVIGGEDFYEFTIDTLVADALNENPPVPPQVRIFCNLTRISILANIYNDGNWKARAPANFYFEQNLPYSTSINDFLVGFDPDPYIFDIRVVDDGTINRDMLVELTKFSRPLSERIYIRYYSMIDKFTDPYVNQWTTLTGTITHDSTNNEITLGATTNTEIQNTTNNSDEWTDYCVTVKARSTIAEKYFEIRMMYQDADNYIYLRIEPNTVPHIPAGIFIIGKVVFGTNYVISSGNFDWFDLDVNYMWKMVCVESNTNIIIQCYQDENLFYNGVTNNPFTELKGKISLLQESNGESIVSYVDTYPFPMESDYISI